MFWPSVCSGCLFCARWRCFARTSKQYTCNMARGKVKSRVYMSDVLLSFFKSEVCERSFGRLCVVGAVFLFLHQC